MSKGAVFAKELKEKLRSVGGDVKQSDPPLIKRLKAIAILYAVVSDALDKIEGDDGDKDRAIDALRESYDAMIDSVSVAGKK